MQIHEYIKMVNQNNFLYCPGTITSAATCAQWSRDVLCTDSAPRPRDGAQTGEQRQVNIDNCRENMDSLQWRNQDLTLGRGRGLCQLGVGVIQRLGHNIRRSAVVSKGARRVRPSVPASGLSYWNCLFEHCELSRHACDKNDLDNDIIAINMCTFYTVVLTDYQNCLNCLCSCLVTQKHCDFNTFIWLRFKNTKMIVHVT